MTTHQLPPEGTATDASTAPETGAAPVLVPVAIDISSPAALAHSISQILTNNMIRPADDVEAFDGLQAITTLINKVHGYLALTTDDFRQHRLATEQKAGIPARRRGKGLAGEVSKATKMTAGSAGSFLKYAETLCHDMPLAFDALMTGVEKQDNLWAMIKKLAGSTPAQFHSVDQDLAEDYGTTTAQQLTQHAINAVNRTDPQNALKRAEAAHKARYVRVSPDGDGMSKISGLLPSDRAQRIDQILDQYASSLVASGNTAHPDDPTGQPRTTDQIRADLFADIFHAGANPTPEPEPKRSFTGESFAKPVPEVPPKTEVVLVMNATTFLGLDDDPVQDVGQGQLPAELVRKKLAHEDLDIFLRRLFLDPQTGDFVRLDSRSRSFPKQLRKLLLIRDNRCANPFCDNAIDVIDHITRHADGGATSFANGQGLCKYCNQLKENRGWTHTINPDGSITETLPTGHQFHIRPRTRFGSSTKRPPPQPPPDPPDPG